ncbi:MAG TPA: exo-alpha-sialidase, partial [Vicinamibacteria bacterium]|nr:exo-alpha-sialidase [Vicinamibacteria bacterium]
LDQEGVYVGTSNGEVYASANGGDRWQRLPGTLPPILSVTAAVY